MANRPSRNALRDWLKVTGCGQGRLGEAVGVGQQQISALLTNREPSEDLARLLQEATGVPWEGWFAPSDLARREGEREARLKCARALRSAFPLSTPSYA